MCNECADGSFHLSTQNPDGCLKCFCMGVSRQCTSSSWSRAQVPLQGGRAGPPSPGLEDQVPVPGHGPHPSPFSSSQVHGASEEPGHFSLTNAASTHTTTEGIFSPTPGELGFSSFHRLLSGPYFWSLPSHFLGDKVGSGWEGKGNSRQQEQHRQRLGGRRVVVPWENSEIHRMEKVAGAATGPEFRPLLSSYLTLVPGDLLWRRAALHSDPAFPARLHTPARAAIGGAAR